MFLYLYIIIIVSGRIKYYLVNEIRCILDGNATKLNYSTYQYQQKGFTSWIINKCKLSQLVTIIEINKSYDIAFVAQFKPADLINECVRFKQVQVHLLSQHNLNICYNMH